MDEKEFIEKETCPMCEQDTLDDTGYCFYCMKQIIEPESPPFDEDEY